MRLALLLGLLSLLVASAGWAQDAPSTFAAVETLAAKLASEPYKQPPSIDGDMRRLDYDQYRALRPRPDTALWRDGKSLFRAEFFPAGFIYEKPVEIFVVEGGAATPLAITPEQFDFSDTGLKEPPPKLAPAGFRLTYPLNRPDKFDEVVSFLGASYFRLIGRGQVYGGSARGLAIDTGIGKPEEFPFFRAFWLVKPADGATDMTVWALLDSPGATGAFAFTVRPGMRTVIDTKCVLYMRNDVEVLGIAPLTSMFFSGKAAADARRLPAGNPRFGRTLSLDRQGRADLAAAGKPVGARRVVLLGQQSARLRPAPARARLRPLPGQRRQPAGAPRPVGRAGRGLGRRRGAPGRDPHAIGDQRQHRRLLGVALAGAQGRAQGIRVQAVGAGRRAGAVAGRPRRRRRASSACPMRPSSGAWSSSSPAASSARCSRNNRSTADVSLTNGKVSRTYIEALPWKRSWRLFIDFEPESKKPVDMRAEPDAARRAPDGDLDQPLPAVTDAWRLDPFAGRAALATGAPVDPGRADHGHRRLP